MIVVVIQLPDKLSKSINGLLDQDALAPIKYWDGCNGDLLVKRYLQLKVSWKHYEDIENL